MKVPINTVCFQCSYNKGLATQNIENGQVAFFFKKNPSTIF